MDRLNRFIAQVYGYAVCLITVIVMLVSVKGIIDAAFDLSDPIRAGGGYGRFGGSLSSYTLYRQGARRMAINRTMGPNPISLSDTLSDADMRQQYQDEREAAIGEARFRATRNLVSGLLFIVIAGVLFVLHWRWLKGITTAVTVEST